MDKTVSLIEFLKMDAVYRDCWWNEACEERYRQLEKEVESSFLITSTDYAVDHYNKFKKYKIKSTNRPSIIWEFLIGPAMFLFASNMQKTRALLLKNEKIQGLFTVKNSFFNRVTIPVAVIFLGGNTDLIWLTSVTSTEDVITLFRDRKQYSRKIYYTNVLDPRNFMPEHYNDEIRAVNEALDNYETRKLNDIADIILGKSVPSRSLTYAGIPYLRARNIQNGKIIGTDTYVPYTIVKDYAKQLLQEGDILLSKNFGQHKIAKVTEEDLPAIASNGLFIIRAFDVPGDYLYQYITSNTGNKIFEKQLSSIEKGATITSINLKDLRELRVPIFDDQTMFDFSQIDSLNSTDIARMLYSSQSSAYHVFEISEHQVGDSLEREVYNMLLQSGWDKNEIIHNSRRAAINVNSMTYIPDMLLLDNEKRLAVVEMTRNLSYMDSSRVRNLNGIIESGQIPFLILTTGNYYEIHASKNKIIKKMDSAPTKKILLSMISGEEV